MKNIEKLKKEFAELSAKEIVKKFGIDCERCVNDPVSCKANCRGGNVQWLEQEAEKPSIFEPKERETYYSVNYAGQITEFENTNWSADKGSIAFGNACTDKSVMERKAHDLKLWSLLWNFAEENNDEMDWDDANESKYYIYKDCMNKRWYIASNLTCSEMVIYFSSHELAQRAIDEIVIPWERGEL